MARLQPFQRHAITAPVFDKTKLHRARLVQILQDNLWRKLILIVAPAGYGKTTLLADLTAHTDRPVCWVRLTEHDQDAMRLARVIVESVGRRFPRVRRGLDLAGLEGYPSDGAGRALASALRHFVSRSWLLVLDDVPAAAHSSEILGFIRGLLEDTPPNLCCVLSSRAVPGIPLFKPVVDGTVFTVGTADLAFTAAELGELLEASGGPALSADEQQSLVAEAGGWIAGICLLLMQELRGLPRDPKQGIGLAFDYFASEVLVKMEEPMRRQIVASSALPVMTGRAIEGVLGVDHGSAWLNSLARAGLFVAASWDSGNTYEYHPLFHRYLRAELARTTARGYRRRLLRRVGDYLAKNGGEGDAIDIYSEAGLARKAVRLAEHIGDSFAARGEFRTIEGWVAMADSAGLPALELRAALIESVALRGDPLRARRMIRQILRRYGHSLSRIQLLGLVAWDAWISAFHGNPAAPARKARAILDEVGPHDRHRAGRLSNATLALTEWAREENLEGAEWHARAAVRSARARKAKASAAFMENLLSNVLFDRGKVGEAREADKRAEWKVSGWKGFGQAIDSLNAAYWAQCELRWGDALTLCESARAVAEEWSLREEVRESRIRAAEVLLNLGLIREALEELDGGDWGPIRNIPLWELILYTCYARAYRLAGDAASARRWLARARSLPAPYRNNSCIEVEVFALGVSRNQVAPALTMNHLRSRLRRGKGSARALVLIETLSAIQTWRRGSREEALDILLAATQLASRTGNLAHLCGELESVPQLKALAERSLPSDPSVERLRDGLRAASETRALIVRDRGHPVRHGLRFQALGDELIVSNERRLSLKPLFSEVFFFVLDQKRINRDLLHDTFWPGKEIEKQRAAAHSAFYGIRKVLGQEAILVRGEVIACGKDLGDTYDVSEFERTASEALRGLKTRRKDLSQAEEAIRTYGGPFLPGRSRQWVIDRRRVLQGLFRNLTCEFADACARQGKSEDASNPVSRALSYDPLDERLVIIAAKIHSAIGRNAHALQCLSEYRMRLNSELGLEPSEEFVLLEQGFGKHAYQEGVAAW